MPERDLLSLAEKSAENDLAFLIKAKEDAKRRLKEDPSERNTQAFMRARDAVDAETRRLQQGASTGRVLKTQNACLAFLVDAGFKISKSQLSRDVAARKLTKTPEGYFDEQALLAYANVHLQPTAQVENRALSDATVRRLEADAEQKKLAAERTRLKLAKEQGLLMEIAAHEDDLAARALFFRSEIEAFGYRVAGELIALVGGDPDKQGDFLAWWQNATADWMDAWAADRDFNTELDESAAPDPAETTQEGAA